MIEDVITGMRISTSVRPIEPGDLESLGPGWRFAWLEEAKKSEVFRLVLQAEPDRTLGLVALRRFHLYVEITLLESNPEDVGRAKKFRGIAGRLIASAAQVSFEIGGEGFVALDSKTELMEHDRVTYGFKRVGGSQRMILDALPAARLIEVYGGR